MQSAFHGLVLAVAVASAGCIRQPVPVDARPTVTHDAGVDGNLPFDAGRCVEEPLEASCWYHGYGSTCGVPCAFTEECTFEVRVTWSDCTMPGWDTYFVDCLCMRGTAWCRPAHNFRPRALPTNYCERFPERDAGEDPDVDASDELDAGSDVVDDAGGDGDVESPDAG